MTRKELMSAIVEKTKVSAVTAELVVGAIFDTIIPEKLAQNEIVVIHNFGKFVPVFKAAHTGRNPSTGLPVEVAEKMTLKFSPATALKNALN
jgi:DNA-binding protein HU-beta